MPDVRVAAALIASLFLSCAFAAPFAIRVGESRVALDAPPGFADTSFIGSPRLQELAESLTSPSNRILLFALSDGDLRKFSVGDPLELRRYMLVVTPKELEREHVGRTLFGQFAFAALRDVGETLPPGRSFIEYFDAQPPGKPGVLGEVRRDPEVTSMLVGARVESPGRTDKRQYVVSSTTFMRVRGKALNLGVFSAYESPADLEWVRTVTARWIDDLQRLNADR